MSQFDEFAKNMPLQELPQRVQQRHLKYLRSLDPTPNDTRRRRRPAIIGGAALLVAAGGGTAAAFTAFNSSPSHTGTAFCYATANLDDSPANRVEFAVSSTGTHRGNAAAAAIDICPAYWRSGTFRAGGTADNSRVPIGGTGPVPHLIACVLKSGALGVFPGDDHTCGALGLQVAH